MEQQPIQNELTFTESALTSRIGGIFIFVTTLFIYFFFKDVPFFIPIISAVIMVIVILFAADTKVSADKTFRTLTVEKNV